MPLSTNTLWHQEDNGAQPQRPHRLLSRDEVDSIYGIPKRFLELAAGKDVGPIFVKIGRRTRYRVQDVEAWIAKNRYVSLGKVVGQQDQA